MPELPDLELPKVKCQYNFWKQYKAIFIKRRINLFRAFGSLFAIGLPVIFISLGVIVSSIISFDNKIRELYLKKTAITYFLVWAFIFNTSSYCGHIVIDR